MPDSLFNQIETNDLQKNTLRFLEKIGKCRALSDTGHLRKHRPRPLQNALSEMKNSLKNAGHVSPMFLKPSKRENNLEEFL